MAAPDLRGEIAWARAAWPDELRDVQFRSPVDRLLAWTSGHRRIDAFLYSPEHACSPVELTRGTDLEGKAPALRVTIIGRRRVENGRQLRDLAFGSAGAILQWDDDTSAAGWRQHDGTWKVESSSGYGSPPTELGALTSVDDQVARFAGEPLELTPYCSGPIEWLACSGGGEHPCDRCENVDLLLFRPGLSGRGYGGRKVACQEACPKYPLAPAIARLNALSARVTPWRAAHLPPAEVPALYRSRDDCLRDHPPASARAKG